MFFIDSSMPFDACTIWCSYDFHKRMDHGVNMNINANNQYREMLVGMKNRAGFLFCQKCFFQPILPYWETEPSLEAFSWYCPQDAALLIFPSPTLCSAWLADYHFLLSIVLMRATPDLTTSLQKKRDAQDQEKWGKGDNLLPTSTISQLPEHGAAISWAETAEAQWGFTLLSTTSPRPHRPQHLAGHNTNAAESAPGNTFLCFCFYQQSLHYPVGQSQPLFLH